VTIWRHRNNNSTLSYRDVWDTRQLHATFIELRDPGARNARVQGIRLTIAKHWQLVQMQYNWPMRCTPEMSEGLLPL
jgi:hypothetical protein